MKTAILILYIASAIMNGITAEKYLIVSRRFVQARVPGIPQEYKISPAGLANGSPEASSSSAPAKTTLQRTKEFAETKGIGSGWNLKARASIKNIFQNLKPSCASKGIPEPANTSGPIKYTAETKIEDGPLGEAETYERPTILVMRLNIPDGVVNHYDKMFTYMSKEGDLVGIHSIHTTKQYSLTYIGYTSPDPTDYFFIFEILTEAILPSPVEFNK